MNADVLIIFYGMVMSTLAFFWFSLGFAEDSVIFLLGFGIHGVIFHLLMIGAYDY